MWPFKKKEKLKMNALYIFKENKKNPFAPPPHKVQVKDIKGAYVLYYFCTGAEAGQNGSMKISDFQLCYKLYW